jgi:HupE / UreJ protein
LIDTFGVQLKEYVLTHWKIKSENNQDWTIVIEKMRVDSVAESASGAYNELIINLLLNPPIGESNRVFTMNFDVITHQVVTHSTLVTIRQDWETGIIADYPSEIGVIETDIVSNTVLPFKINRVEGSIWKGFKSMIQLGMSHIAEGTDHLLFLLVLLIPAPLLVENRRWSSYIGLKKSVGKLLKIITAFTIGHSMTLLLGTLGWIPFSSRWIEILIAFSIMISAFHAIFPVFYQKEIYIAAGFGLIHGLAFSNTLIDLNLNASQTGLSILGFNLGIELMQLIIMILILPSFLVMCNYSLSFYQKIRVIAAISAIFAAFAWMLERITTAPNIVSTFLQNAHNHLFGLIAIIAFVAIWNYILKSKINKNQ